MTACESCKVCWYRHVDVCEGLEVFDQAECDRRVDCIRGRNTQGIELPPYEPEPPPPPPPKKKRRRRKRKPNIPLLRKKLRGQFDADRDYEGKQ